MKIPLISLKHFRRKLFSLGLAIILWFFVTENNVIVEQKTVDIEYRGLPDNVIMVESLQKLSYTISKNPYYPSDIKSTIKPYVNVNDATPGWHNFRIYLDVSPPLPTYATVHPSVSTTRILLDNRSSKSALVKPDITLSNTQDFSITDIRITPAITQISGPDSVLENIKNVFLNPVTISHAGDYKLDAKIISPAHSVSIQDTKASLQFSVNSNYKTATLVIPVAFRNLSPNLRLSDTSLSSVTLRIRGLNSEISALRDNEKSIAYLDLLNVDSSGVYPKVPLKIDIPENIAILNARSIPSAIDISVENAPITNTPEDSENSERKSDTPNSPTPEEKSKETSDSIEPLTPETPQPIAPTKEKPDSPQPDSSAKVETSPPPSPQKSEPDTESPYSDEETSKNGSSDEDTSFF